MKSVAIKECTFQPEKKIVRYATDIIGDPLKEKYMEENKNNERKVKLVQTKSISKSKQQQKLDEFRKNKRDPFDYLKNDEPPKPFSGSVKDIEKEIQKRRKANQNDEDVDPLPEKQEENKISLTK